jgi:RHS repeat-associated protein
LAARQYDAFGMLVASTGTPQGPFGYAGGYGYQEDADSGLKLLGHRYYDPSTGRFLTRDPVKDGRNWYSYCENEPTVGVDPSALWKITCGPSFTAGLIVGVNVGVNVE